MAPGLRKLKLASDGAQSSAQGSPPAGGKAGGSPFARSSRQHTRQESIVEASEQSNACTGLLHKLVPPRNAVMIRPEFVVLGAVVYGVLFFSMGHIWLPGNAAFCSVLIWACSLVLAEVARWLRLPRVVGMLAAGILLANMPGAPIAAFPKKWGVQMRAAALATIFLRCGLELEFKTMNLYKWPALRLAFVPGVIEALFDAGVASALFRMPYTLALSMGFILKAVGPGLVVPAMFVLQKEGWGADKGVPSTVVIAASFDDIIAITGFSIFINIAIAGGDNAAWQIASGPLQVLFGIGGGLLAGAILGCTKIWDNKYKRFIGIYGSALLLMFFLESFDMLSGGALGALFVGLATCFFWERGVPGRISNGPNSSYAPDIERVMAKVWNWVMEPLLFGTIGASIMFAKLQSTTIPKACCVVLTGLVLRCISTFVVMYDRKYTWRERAFYAVAWTPKATVQASLSAVPLALIQTLMAGRPDYDVWFQWGQDILTTGVFAIIICGSLGTLLMFMLAPVLLKKGESPLIRARSEGRVQGSGNARPSVDFSATLSRMTTTSADGGVPAAGGAARASIDSRPLLSMDDLHGLKDHSLIEEYFDAIEQLLTIVRDEATLPPESRRERALDLCNNISNLQERIDQEVGPREMTVRQMLHHTALRSRQPSLTGGPEGGLPTIASAGHLHLSASDGDGTGSGGSAGGRVVIDVRRATKDGVSALESVPSDDGAAAALGSLPPASAARLPAARVSSSGGGGIAPEEIQRVEALAALARSVSGRSPTGSASAGARMGSPPV